VADGLEVPAEIVDTAVADLLGFALAHERQAGHWVVNIAFVDQDEIARLHEQFLSDPAPTDIITFPFDGQDELGGDIAICVPVAARQSVDHGKSLADELLFLALHGVLHLVGYDDSTPELRAAMLNRQQELHDGWLAINR
jgi:probable rRNA maturation factor